MLKGELSRALDVLRDVCEQVNICFLEVNMQSNASPEQNKIDRNGNVP